MADHEYEDGDIHYQIDEAAVRSLIGVDENTDQLYFNKVEATQARFHQIAHALGKLAHDHEICMSVCMQPANTPDAQQLAGTFHTFGETNHDTMVNITRELCHDFQEGALFMYLVGVQKMDTDSHSELLPRVVPEHIWAQVEELFQQFEDMCLEHNVPFFAIAVKEIVPGGENKRLVRYHGPQDRMSKEFCVLAGYVHGGADYAVNTVMKITHPDLYKSLKNPLALVMLTLQSRQKHEAEEQKDEAPEPTSPTRH